MINNFGALFLSDCKSALKEDSGALEDDSDRDDNYCHDRDNSHRVDHVATHTSSNRVNAQ